MKYFICGRVVMSKVALYSQPDLRSAMGELFCQSLTRYPSDADISVSSDYNKGANFISDAIKSVLTRDDMKKKYIVSCVSTCCNKLLSRFRTEQRRKVSEANNKGTCELRDQRGFQQ